MSPGNDRHANIAWRLEAAASSRWRSWRDRLVRIAREVDRSNLPVVAGGLAFFALLSASPLLIAVVSLYGLVCDPPMVEDQVNHLATILPDDIRRILAEQLRGVVEMSADSLSLSAAVSVGAALWVASKGTFYLVRSLNAAFGVVETRSIVRMKIVSVLVTTLLVASTAIVLALVAVLPSVAEIVFGHAAPVTAAIELGRWPALALGMTVVLSILYRYGPNRSPRARWRWWTPGSVLATVGWLAGSYGFSVYVSSVGKFNEIYGSLGAVVVLMSWLYAGAFVVLLGALVDATRPAGDGGRRATG